MQKRKINLTLFFIFMIIVAQVKSGPVTCVGCF